MPDTLCQNLMVDPVHRTKVRWRFRKILWPSQNIWTLQTSFTEVVKYLGEIQLISRFSENSVESLHYGDIVGRFEAPFWSWKLIFRALVSPIGSKSTPNTPACDSPDEFRGSCSQTSRTSYQTLQTSQVSRSPVARVGSKDLSISLNTNITNQTLFPYSQISFEFWLSVL